MRLRKTKPPLLQIALIGVLFSLALFFSIEGQLKKGALLLQQQNISDRAALIQENLHRVLIESEALRRLYLASESITSIEFNEFATPLIQNIPGIDMIAWAPTAARGESRIRFIEPRLGNEQRVGFLLNSSSQFQRVLQLPIEKNTIAVSEGVFNDEKWGDSESVFLFLPILKEEAKTVNGWLLVSIHPGDLIDESIRALSPRGVHIAIWDNSGKEKKLLGFHFSRNISPGATTNVSAIIRRLDRIKKGFDVPVGRQMWEIDFYPDPELITESIGPNFLPYLFLLIGLLVTAALSLHSLKENRVRRQIGTDSEKNIQECRENERRLRSIIENAQAIIFILDRQGVFLLSEGKALARLGLSPGQLVGISAMDLYQPYPAITESIRKALNGEYVHVVSSLPTAVFDVIYSPYFDSQGKQIGITGIGIDITDQKIAEEKVLEWTRRYEYIVEASGQTVYEIFNFAKKIIWGASIEKLLGYTPEEMAQDLFSLADLAHPDDRPTVLKSHRNTSSPASNWDIEYRLRHRNGHDVWVRDRGFILSGKSGNSDSQLGLLEDITDRKLAQEQTERMLRETRFRYELSQAFAYAESESEVLDLMIAKAGIHPEMMVSISLWTSEKARDMMRLCRRDVFQSGVVSKIPLGTSFPVADYPSITRLSIGEAFICENARTDPALDPNSLKLMKIQGLESIGIFPISAGKDWLGVLQASSPRAVRFTEEMRLEYGIISSLGGDALRAARLRETIRSKEQRLSLFFQQSPLGVIEWNTRLEVTDWNPAAERIFGFSRDEALHQRVLEPISSSPKNHEIRDLFEKVFDGGEGFHHISSHSTRQGKPIACEWFVTPLKDQQGQIVGAMSLVEDITERKTSEEALHQAQAFSQALLDSLPGIFYLYSYPEMKMVRWNKNYEFILGYSAGELDQHTLYDLHRPEEKPQLEKYNEITMTKGLNMAESSIRRKDGGYTPFLLSGCRFDAGEQTYVMGVGIDITELKKVEAENRVLYLEMEQRVKDRTRELTNANLELESFTYSVSHDLRAPLRAIDGFAKILSEEYQSKLDAEGQRLCRVITENSKKMGQLIDHLLAFSRMGRAKMSSSHIDMKRVVSEVLQDVLPEQNVQPDFISVGNLPPVKGDREMIRRMWTNLISNALKFTSDVPSPHIEIGSYEKDGENVYFIRDNGAGFDMKFANKLFGVFQRLHGDKEFEGHGVGLALVKRIVERHGGTIRAEGEVGKGAAFYFTLPGIASGPVNRH